MEMGERDTDVWLREKRFKIHKSGPGYYNSKLIQNKESFNYGKIPFGTSIDRFRHKGGALDTGNLYCPGPGKY